MNKAYVSIAAGLAAVCAFPLDAPAEIINLGAASNYAVLGLGGIPSSLADFEVYQSATVIDGNVGVGPYSVWTHGIDATINGRVDYDLTVAAPIVTGTIAGGLHQLNMAPAVVDARAVSAVVAGYAPTQTFTTLSSGQTIVGNGGLNVIRVTDDIGLSGGSTTLNLSGGPSDQFLFQITSPSGPSAHTLTLSGVTMNLRGGITADNIMWNMHGVGGGIVISSSATVYGIFLAPDRGILVDNATVYGAVIGGGGLDSHSNSVSVHSSSHIVYIPTPGAAALIALGGIVGLRRRRAPR